MEDEEVVREMAMEILQESGYQVLQAKTARERSIVAASMMAKSI